MRIGVDVLFGFVFHKLMAGSDMVVYGGIKAPRLDVV